MNLEIETEASRALSEKEYIKEIFLAVYIKNFMILKKRWGWGSAWAVLPSGQLFHHFRRLRRLKGVPDLPSENNTFL